MIRYSCFSIMVLTAFYVPIIVSLPTLRAEETLKLRFGVYATEKRYELYEKFKPALTYLEDHLEKELSRSVRVRLRIFNTYKVGREALVKGYVDFARFGPASYILAREEEPGLEIIAIEEQKGTHFFKGVIAVRGDSDIKTVADLKGKSFAFGDPTSTIGRYLAQGFLLDAGIRADDLARFEYLLRHDKVAEAVLAGEFTAGAMKESTFSKYSDKGLVALATFANVTKPWVARSGLDPKVVDAIRSALVSLDDKETLKAVGKKLSGFRPGDDQLYDFVREGMAKAAAFDGEVPEHARAGGSREAKPLGAKTPAR